MAITQQQSDLLRAKLIDIMSSKALSPDNFTWADIETGIAALSAAEKERIAKSLAGSGDSIESFVRDKLKAATIAAITPQVDQIIAAGAVPLDVLAIILL